MTDLPFRMKFKATGWDKELEFEPFKKINIFVGEDLGSIDELFIQLEKKDLFITDMHLGSNWYYKKIECVMSKFLEDVIASDLTMFAYVNSLEIIGAFPKIIKQLKLEDDFQLIRIGKDTRKSTRGDPIATYISCEALATMLEMGLEVR